MKTEVLAALTLTLWACGAPSTPDAGVDAGTDAGLIATPGTGDAGTLVGTFALLHSNGSASLFGKVYDGPTPATLVWELDTVDGDCRLLTPRVPFCATPCGGSAVCVENDVCQSYPASKPVGLVHVTGVLNGGGAFDMSPINNGYQPPAAVTLAVPPFADGEPITLRADGSAAVQAFTLTTTGVMPLSLTSTALTLQPGAPLELTWPGSSTARVEVKLDISHHGGTRGMITCDTADDGALTISAALTTRLIALGVSGFPTVVVRRERVGLALITAGRVDLRVGSELEQAVTIPGLTSCTDTSQCPMGQACQNDLRCN
ncbi:MAG: hypothetical protein Q8L48_38570 [Archangium sp.]|nr:hypothetical protein [Archangium sp.]